MQKLEKIYWFYKSICLIVICAITPEVEIRHLGAYKSNNCPLVPPNYETKDNEKWLQVNKTNHIVDYKTMLKKQKLLYEIVF